MEPRFLHALFIVSLLVFRYCSRCAFVRLARMAGSGDTCRTTCVWWSSCDLTRHGLHRIALRFFLLRVAERAWRAACRPEDVGVDLCVDFVRGFVRGFLQFVLRIYSQWISLWMLVFVPSHRKVKLGMDFGMGLFS